MEETEQIRGCMYLYIILYTHTHAQTHTHLYVSVCIKSIFQIRAYICIERELEREEPRKGKRKGKGEENGKFYFRELTCNSEAWQVQDLQGRLQTGEMIEM